MIAEILQAVNKVNAVNVIILTELLGLEYFQIKRHEGYSRITNWVK